MGTDVVISKALEVNYQVTIFTTMVEETCNKALVLVTPPTPTDDQDGSGAQSTILIDLLMKAEHRITVDGYIETDHGSGDTPGSQTAQVKRTNLKKIFFAGGTFTLAYDGTNYTVNMDKLNITDAAMDETTASKYRVKFTAVEGIDMPARS